SGSDSGSGGSGVSGSGSGGSGAPGASGRSDGGVATVGLAVLAAIDAKRDSEDEEEDAGDVVFTEVETADEGFADRDGDAVDVEEGALAVERGDRSRTWRWPATPIFDRLSRDVPARISPRSPLVARIINDASYLRAMFGSASVLAPVLGAVLGAVAVITGGGEALPPAFGLAVALAVLAVFDALAGLVGVLVFVTGVVASGGASSAAEVRTLLGVATLWFAAPLIAGTARPLRRPPGQTRQEHWDRTADVVIASLVGAWAVQTIVLGLPGLAGLDLPIGARANDLALSVLAALGIRMLIETVAARWFPARLARVLPAELDEPSPGQRALTSVLVMGIFVFVAVSYLGPSWQLYLGGALFVLPKILGLFTDCFPNCPRLYKALPSGIVETVLMLVVDGVFAAIVLGYLSNGQDAIRDAFVLLSLPGLALSLLGLLGREGAERELRWREQLLGIPILAFGVLLVVGVIPI
ncbi:MAG: hypothetical protein QOI56_973, partial [Actinomycetota bacterium]|nr:hypothetical protein [Actinomycetota bacterium]